MTGYYNVQIVHSRINFVHMLSVLFNSDVVSIHGLFAVDAPFFPINEPSGALHASIQSHASFILLLHSFQSPHQPLVRKDLPEIVRALSSMPGVRNVGVTTNGINLRRKLPDLRDAGLTHINVSLVQSSEWVHWKHHHLVTNKELALQCHYCTIGRLVVQVSVDTLRPDRFVAITRRNGLEAVLSSLYAALDLGYGGR